ncbi:hypothetical protein PF001_g22640 [Phytophthora fragariae]|uniref:Uncharacterized protein n=1 Tax=Phytophthora fragariae TaxID=53985 RepID=A0A6A4CAV0_9STRA|nr:hypothetical protein PF001_g22640 [Phytophthora fragariae]
MPKQPSSTWSRKDGSKYQPSSRMTTKQYGERADTEWDLRVDVHDKFTPDQLATHLGMHITLIKFAMISGVEEPDNTINSGINMHWGNEQQPTSASNHNHVHVCLVLEEELCRNDVIRMVLNMEPKDVPKGQVYCKPRYRAWSYGGWVSHHCKDLTKISPTATNCTWQYGSVPREDLGATPIKTLEGWVRTIVKFATPHWREELDHYQQALQRMFDQDGDGCVGPSNDRRRIKLIPTEELANLPH